MGWFIGIAILVIVLVALGKRPQRAKQPAKTFPYERRKTLFSPAERSFLGVLERAVDDDTRILGKVRLADLIDVRKGLSKGVRQGALNRIRSKHVDFILCDVNSAALLCGIELDDSSHERADRRKRDEFVRRAFEAAGLPLLRFPARQGYSLEELRRALEPVLPTLSAGGSVDATLEPLRPTSPPCPTCGADMIKREAKRGGNAGDTFWSCSNYPRCRTTLPMKVAA